jgi:hypothetical protein
MEDNGDASSSSSTIVQLSGVPISKFVNLKKGKDDIVAWKEQIITEAKNIRCDIYLVKKITPGERALSVLKFMDPWFDVPNDVIDAKMDDPPVSTPTIGSSASSSKSSKSEEEQRKNIVMFRRQVVTETLLKDRAFSLLSKSLGTNTEYARHFREVMMEREPATLFEAIIKKYQGQNNVYSYQQLNSEYVNFALDTNEKVSDFVDRFKVLIEQINSFPQAKISNLQQVLHIQVRLPPAYANTVELALDKFIEDLQGNDDKKSEVAKRAIFDKIKEKENALKESKDVKNDETAHNRGEWEKQKFKKKKENEENQRGDKYCVLCQIKGHKLDDCRTKDKKPCKICGKQNHATGQCKSCRNCGKLGHFAKRCKKKPKREGFKYYVPPKSNNEDKNEGEENARNQTEKEKSDSEGEGSHNMCEFNLSAMQGQKQKKFERPSAFIDSAASFDYVENKEWFSETHKAPKKIAIQTANGPIYTDTVGTVKLRQKGNDEVVVLRDARLVPNTGVNLISVVRRDRDNYKTVFENGKAKIVNKKTGNVALKGQAQIGKEADLYKVNDLVIIKGGKEFFTLKRQEGIHASIGNVNLCTGENPPETPIKKIAVESEVGGNETLKPLNVKKLTFESLHQRLHFSLYKLQRLARYKAISGIEKLGIGKVKEFKCKWCALFKNTRSPLRQKERQKYGSGSKMKMKIEDKEALKFGERLHCDCLGPINLKSGTYDEKIYKSLGSVKYASVAVDEFSDAYFVKTGKDKQIISAHISELIPTLEVQFNAKTKEVHTDGAKEYLSTKITDTVYQPRGIKPQVSAAYTASENGKAENAIRNLTFSARTLLGAAGLDKSFWPFAIQHAALINKFKIPAGRTKTVAELKEGKIPTIADIAAIPPFGVDALVHVDKVNRDDKFSQRGKLVSFIGFSSHHRSGFLFYDYEAGKVIHSRDVQFLSTFACGRKKIEEKGEKEPTATILPVDDLGPFDELFVPPKSVLRAMEREREAKSEEMKIPEISEKENAQEADLKNTQAVEEKSETKASRPTELRRNPARGARGTSSVGFGKDLNDYYDGDLDRLDLPADEELKNPIFEPTKESKLAERIAAAMENFEEFHEEFAVENSLKMGERKLKKRKDESQIVDKASPYYVPKNIREAMEIPHWKAAVDKEMNSINANQTFKKIYKGCPEAQSLKGQPKVSGRWLFKIKTNENGEILKYKARWVIRGFTQRFGVDYDETYAPTLGRNTFRVSFAVANELDYEAEQLDYVTAFLNAFLKHKIIVQQPEGFESPDVEALELNKSIYGLKQAPREWNEEITNFLVQEAGLTQSKKDSCLFFKTSKTLKRFWITMNVDDTKLFYHRSDKGEVDELKAKIAKKYKIELMGNVNLVLGMKITRNREKKILEISIAHKIEEGLKKFGFENLYEAKTPMLQGQILLDQNSGKDQKETKSAKQSEKIEKLEKKFPYREAVGLLNYLASTARPDIAFATSEVSRFGNNPSSTHVEAVKRIYSYLKRTKYQTLKFVGRKDNGTNLLKLKIDAFTDATWNKNGLVKPKYGFVIRLNGNSVIWKSKTATRLHQSAAESEFTSALKARNELMWTQQILKEIFEEAKNHNTQPKLELDSRVVVQHTNSAFRLATKFDLETNLMVDNLAAINFIKNNSTDGRMNFIDVKELILLDDYKEKSFSLHWIEGTEQLADVFTKALGNNQFWKFTQRIMNLDEEE